MEQERQRTYLAPGPGSQPEGEPGLSGSSGGEALRVAQGWESVAHEAAGDCESDADAERVLQSRGQRSGQ